MTNLICGACSKKFDRKIIMGKEDRSLLICPHCTRLLPSSKKEKNGEFVGRQHIHTEWKDGDVVI